MRVRSVFWLVCLLICTCLQNNSSGGGGGVLAQVQPCQDEEAAVEECARDAIEEERLGEDEDDSLDIDLEIICQNQTEALDQCYEDNNISGLKSCRYIISWWSTCKISYNLLLTCRNCPFIPFEQTCEEFGENWCERYNCCNPCRHFLTSYVSCVEQQGICEDEMDCDEENRLDFWGKFFISVACVVGAAILIFLLIVAIRKHINRNDNASPPPEPVKKDEAVKEEPPTATDEQPKEDEATEEQPKVEET